MAKRGGRRLKNPGRLRRLIDPERSSALASTVIRPSEFVTAFSIVAWPFTKWIGFASNSSRLAMVTGVSFPILGSWAVSFRLNGIPFKTTGGVSSVISSWALPEEGIRNAKRKRLTTKMATMLGRWSLFVILPR